MEEKKPRIFLVSHEIAKKFYQPDTSVEDTKLKKEKYLRKKAKLSRNLNKEMRKAG